ncbi:ParB N-terminal domain-containing protein [Sulfitobacter sp. HNIBRBA3233]|uniref:ParB N-terminal domain-containing protein n=1 Tax=Sulfitobacter marinivivus TaxID=3158558 RepID=UPI0032DF1CE6
MAKRKRLGPVAFSDEDAPLTRLIGPALTGGATAPISGIVQDAASAAALEELSDTLRRAREDGRMVLELPLEQIEFNHLVRDRVALDPEELDALAASLRARGQQTPIEVVALGPDRYGLISGWRRCQALLHLARTEGRPAQVLALLRQPQDAADAYLAMVEENEIRVGLSYYERARIVLRAVEQGVYDSDKTALQSLFANASRAKRSKIGSFTHIVRALDPVLRFPTHLPERTGLALARLLEDEPGFAMRMTQTLSEAPQPTPEDERAVIDRALAAAQAEEAPRDAGTPPAPRRSPAKGSVPPAPPTAADGTASAAVPSPAPEVQLTENADGSVTIGGAGLTAQKRALLRAWCAENL